MKKKYLKPDVLLVEIELQNMIALSATETEAVQNGEVLGRDDEDIFDLSGNPLGGLPF